MESAYGTDFSPRLVQAAEREARTFLSPHLAGKLSFHVARNESLLQDLSSELGRRVEDLVGSFDLIVGVNTFRYCHRLGKEVDCAADIYRLLRPGGVCVIIDMNNRLPGVSKQVKGLR